MTSFICLTEKISSNEFRCNYLKNKKLFLNFFLRFKNLYQTLNISQKIMILIADVFAEVPGPKNMVR